MRNYQDTFETRKRSFINAFSICMTVPLNLENSFRLSEHSMAVHYLCFFILYKNDLQFLCPLISICIFQFKLISIIISIIMPNFPFFFWLNMTHCVLEDVAHFLSRGGGSKNFKTSKIKLFLTIVKMSQKAPFRYD